jgi:hypothetical protein
MIGPHIASIESAAAMRDLDVLKRAFYEEFDHETNDILTLYTYWQVNFSKPE